MSFPALAIPDATTARLKTKSIAMAESNHSGSTSSSNNDASVKRLERPSTGGKERKLSSSQLELNRCLETENIDSEPLLKQYSCAWHRDGSLLIQGHLYITANYVCFYSSILGWETKLVIKCREVIQIFKQKTALIIPNAISITTLQHEFFFTSFIHRNSAFRVLQCTWKSSMNGINLTKPDLIRMIQSKKEGGENGSLRGDGSANNLILTTTDNEEDLLSTGGSNEDISRGTGSTSMISDPDQTDNSSIKLRVGNTRLESTSDDTETDSCLNTQSVTSTGSTTFTTDGLEEAGSLKRSLSLMRLNSEEFGVLEEVDGAATPNKDSKSEGSPDASVGRDNLSQLVQIGGYGVSYSQLINTLIIVLITVLVFSMLILLCKLSQLDPNLKAWLSWQPWCQVICS
ncbi:PREDICTED: GRAM domain-containing protein 1B-like [Amphimedon queenslandica]|uniref:GRAM domain-containing protein n=1 Tax=Amphimedon queenslandica TaxID=400682 RepID=A0A1X7U6J7_AMPQE|nr:PREDICTED: GRAM domain-containing protein 1B-like [Amphimedon queenslandica]|eukprot:XP_003388869.2 PREDICTED: GRAM domain-containing protein 1B-like [Amphimedon queenslandica]